MKFLKAMALAATVISWCSAGSAIAAPYPEKIIKLVVPFAPGGPTDSLARRLGEAAGNLLGQKIMIENRAGAGGNIGSEMVANAPPDGYTIMLGTSGPLAINVSLYKRVGFDPLKSFAPVILLGAMPNVIMAHASVPASNVNELTAYAKANPNSLNFGSAGAGSTNHLGGVLFNILAGTNLEHIPYRGTAPALNDLVAGHVKLMFSDILTAKPHIESGAIKALAITTKARAKGMPNVPTAIEQGLKGYDVSLFFGIVAPAGTPADIIAKLNDAFTKAMADPDIARLLASQGLETPSDLTPAGLKAHMEAEVALWRDVIKKANITVD